MRVDIDELSEEQLVELNHRIVERLKFLDSYHNHNEMMKFNLGEQVSFEPPGRGVIIGTLTRFNKKSVTVITEAGQKWTVAPNLLLKISDVKTKANEAETKLIGK